MTTHPAGCLRRSRAGRLAALLGACLALLALTASAQAATVWDIDSAHGPQHFEPGATLSQYVVQAFNVGDTASSGTVTLTDRLPPGVTSVFAFGFQGTTGLSWDCTGTTTVTCTLLGGDAQPAQAAAVARGLLPLLFIFVQVDPSASGTADNVATIEGGGAASPATATDPTTFSTTPAGFGFAAGTLQSDFFDGQAPAGSPVRQAGSHPFELRVDFNTNLTFTVDPNAGPYTSPDERLRTLVAKMPAGFVGNPEATPKCNGLDLSNSGPANHGSCPTNTQVGSIDLRLNNNSEIITGTDVSFTTDLPVFNMEPPPGAIAAFGFSIQSLPVYILVTLDPVDHSVVATLNYANGTLPIRSSRLTLWGVPADPAHDALRHYAATGDYGAPAGVPLVPYLTLPSRCGVDVVANFQIDSWQHPGQMVDAQAGAGQMAGCGDPRFRFDASIRVRPEEHAPSTPTGLTVDIAVPQKDDTTSNAADLYGASGNDKAIATPPLKDVKVVLPEGMAVSPSSANGLAACSPAQIGFGTASAPSCPDASKIGTLRIDTPVLPRPLDGGVYLAQQNDNPFGSLLALYLVVNDQGVLLKLAGKIAPDPVTGQLTATFDDNPQLPFTNLHVRFKGGARAALVTPATCGVKTTTATLTSWNDALPAVQASDSFEIAGNCVKGFDPGFRAGTTNPAAGKSAPLVTRFTRGDGDEELSTIDISLPQGLLGRIADVVLCADGEANAGTCGDGSLIGKAIVGAGPGSSPFFVTDGRVYMTGPYKGAPFGLSIVVRAKAGPLDLGNVIVRAAVHVDKRTAALRVISDPMPTILQGIPLLVRVVDIAVDRPGFTFNPTNCSEKSASATIGSTGGKSSTKTARFQVGGCAALPFTPRMTIRVGGRGHLGRGARTPLEAVVQMAPGQANLRGVKVTLPKVLNARLDVINRACTLAEFNAGNCDKAKAGTAVAVTPLLRDPLRGNVYFVRNGRPLPDMMVALRGQVDVDLASKVIIPRSNRLSTDFDSVPDVPITKFTLRLVSNRQGPIGNAASLCTKTSRQALMDLAFTAQSGKTLHKSQRLAIAGCKKAKAKGGTTKAR